MCRRSGDPPPTGSTVCHNTTLRSSGARGLDVSRCYRHVAPLERKASQINALHRRVRSPCAGGWETHPLRVHRPVMSSSLRLCALALNIPHVSRFTSSDHYIKKPLINQLHRNNITQATTQPMNFCVLCTAVPLRCFSYVLHLPFSRSLVLSVFFESFFYTPAFCCLGLY